MAFSFTILRRFTPLAAALALLAGCAAAKKPQFVDPDFQQANVRKIALLPLSFDERYYPPYDLDLDRELRARAKTALEGKGYEVMLREGAGAGPKVEAGRLASFGTKGTDAVLAIHVDFLFISENYNEINPPPVIDIEAMGRLVDRATGKELWRDRGSSKIGGVGGQRIQRPDSERFLALTLLAESLFTTLPAAQGP